jgi:predicted regulator of Ras-like GTPase activity (Roadblock/LC7/MglB family)
MAEPFTELLSDLVDRVDGAVGAAFIDNYGEAVQCIAAEGEDDYVKLMGAYQGIALQTSQHIAHQLDAGEVDFFFTAYETASFLVKALAHDYFLLLVLAPEANVGKGIYDIQRSAEAFNREI